MNQSPDKQINKPPPRRLVGAAAAGGMGGLVTLLFFILDNRPGLAETFLERVVIPWGPQFILALLLVGFLFLLADRYAPRLIAAQTETAAALEKLAAAVRQSVERENAFQREQDVLLNHVARQVEALRKAFDSHHRTVTSRLADLEPAADDSPLVVDSEMQDT